MDKQPDRPSKERYGTDELYRFMVVCSALAVILRFWVRKGVLSYVTLGFALLSALLTVLRPLSRNLPARRAENRLYLRLRGRLLASLRLLWIKVRDHDRFAYRCCPCCRAVLRLRRKSGEHTLVCPRCGEHFDIHIR